MTTAPPEAPAKPARERWRAHWTELFDEVVTTGLCTGCAGCVISCPHDVLGYDTGNGVYRPFHLEEEGGPGGCGHGDRGCTSCTRACPRFRHWEPEIDTYLHGRERLPEEQAGVTGDIFLARAADPELHQRGQDGGLVSAILAWCLEHDRIDALRHHLLDEADLFADVSLVFQAADQQFVLGCVQLLMGAGAIFHAFEEGVGEGFHDEGDLGALVLLLAAGLEG